MCSRKSYDREKGGSQRENYTTRKETYYILVYLTFR